MPTTLTTQLSLLLRIRDASDEEAWSIFVRIYGPVIYRYGLHKGLQDADAADLVQDVLREVSQSIGRFQYDPAVGKFRSWLFTVSRYTLNRIRTSQQRQTAGSGDSRTMHALSQLPADADAPDAFWVDEYERRIFQWAAEHVRPRVQKKTWDAFWKTAVEGQPASAVARELDMNVGSVYVAKNRVLARLQERIRMIDAE